jgi:Ni2+-binding GTPase involved in maturation of urease and hydrogenase
MIAGIRKQDVEPVTDIGMRGPTGCGKTSVINALCDILHLMPSSPTESTTVTITELHHSKNGSFRVEVEFIEQDE